MNTEIIVRPIPSNEAEPWILARHYQRRMCMIIHAFGAFRGIDLIGVVTYGVPASPHLCRGICGEEWASRVLELNRLCCENTKDTASQLVGRSLRMLPKPSIVVSYADTKQGHVGYVYQATNWIYTGLSAKRMDAVKVGEENKHSRGKWGEGFEYIERSRKHRYIFFVASKSQKKKLLSLLRYEQQPYPKGESKRYDANATIDLQTSFC
jgi:hypothetical protein